jgi:hypothetical protein
MVLRVCFVGEVGCGGSSVVLVSLGRDVMTEVVVVWFLAEELV